MSVSHLRPLSFGEILDGAFALYRRNFVVFVTTALVPLLPGVLLLAVLGFWVQGENLTPSDFNLMMAAALLVLLAGSLLGWGALVHEASRAVEGGVADRGEAYRVSIGRVLPALGAGVFIVVLVCMGFLLLVVPGLLAAIALFATWHVVIVEGRGPVEAISRSWELSRGAWGRISGIMLVSFIIVMLPNSLVARVMNVGMALVGGIPSDPEALIAAFFMFMAVNLVLVTLVSALTAPFMAAALTLLYYDRRVRTEALDLEMAADRLGVPA